MARNRLSKILAQAGLASRRAAEKLIFEGKVTVNGQKILVPQTMADPTEDLIIYNGKKVLEKEPRVIFLLNKPKGYICSNRKLEGKKILLDLFPDCPYRLFPVGRLDRDTKGLILVTNDGDLAHRVMHPSFGIQKEYLIKTKEEINADHLRKISKGVRIDGALIIPASVEKVRRGTLKITVNEGKKHEVRILVKSAGLKLAELTRIRIGNIHLGKIPEGCYRLLSKNEKESLLQIERKPIKIAVS